MLYYPLKLHKLYKVSFIEAINVVYLFTQDEKNETWKLMQNSENGVMIIFHDFGQLHSFYDEQHVFIVDHLWIINI